MDKKPKKKHFLTITFKILDYWFDFDREKVYVLMVQGSKLILVERDFK